VILVHLHLNSSKVRVRASYVPTEACRNRPPPCRKVTGGCRFCTAGIGGGCRFCTAGILYTSHSTANPSEPVPAGCM